ncbi:MAG: DUF2167 domain-containing protein [Steroidobacteraceae bacterium]
MPPRIVLQTKRASPQIPDGYVFLDKANTRKQFDAGGTYAEYKPGDKIAEYGLAGLIVGGAAVAASGWLCSLWAKRT